MDLIFNQNTKKSIDLFLTSPGHLLLLTGKKGSGKLSVANHLIANLIGTKNELLSKNQFFLHIFPENNSISIEEVRKLQKFLILND
jgi:tRNA uridine 5-carbamoylmethylation protein Kti12